MSKAKIVIISVIAVLAMLTLVMFNMVMNMYTPTTGAQIGKYAKPEKALLVIDVQQDYTGLRGSKAPLFRDADTPINAINQVIEAASQAGMQVVYIRQVFDNNFIMRTFVGRTIDGLPGTELDDRIKVVSKNDFTKRKSDAFSSKFLESFLVSHQVDDLYLVGLDAAYCVHKTALGGLNRGYKVTVLTDAVLTRKNITDVLKQYAKDGIKMTTSIDLIGSMKKTDRKNDGYRMLPAD